MLRTPWRLALFLLVAGVATWVAGGLLYAPLQTLGSWMGLRPILHPWVAVIGLLIAHEVCLRRVDGLPWSASGLGAAAARPALLAKGALLGGVAIGVPSTALWAIGFLRLEPGPPGSSIAEGALALLALAPAAFLEELATRGYVLTVLRKVMDWRVAVMATSIVFGVMHSFNPGASAWLIVVVIVAGIMLGTIVVATGSLYAATAAHLAWNWIMAGVLHVPVSGLGFATPDYRLVDAGPDWATGGAWGPEGGVGAVLGMGGALAYLYARHKRSREA